MKFSFIIIGKNEERTLEKCLLNTKRFAQENNFEFEIIYVDSKSTDKSLEIAQSSKYVNTLALEGKCSAARARNLGASFATGEVLMFVDGDMILKSSFGKNIIVDNELVHPFITGYWIDYYYDDHGNSLENNSFEIDNNKRNQYQIKTGGLFIIKRSLWLQVGGMDNRLVAFEDLDLAYRIHKKFKIKAFKIGEVLADHHTINYTSNFRFKNLVFSNYFKYRGILYRKNLDNLRILLILFRHDLSLTVLLITVIISFLSFNFYFLVIYFLASVFRLFLAKSKEQNVSFFMRLYFNLIIDIQIILGFVVFYPKNILPKRDMINFFINNEN